MNLPKYDHWAAAWQNQSDQSLHWALNRQLRTQYFFMRTAKTLIRLGGCAGWSESLLGAHVIVLDLSGGGSYVNVNLMADRGVIFINDNIWAATWQNQQIGCAPSEDSDQPGHPPSLIRVFAVRMRLGGRPGWSESSLVAHSFCWFCHVVAHLSFNPFIFDIFLMNLPFYEMVQVTTGHTDFSNVSIFHIVRW